MPDLSHEAYLNQLTKELARLAIDPDRRAEIDDYAVPILIMVNLDLDPARPVLEQGYGRDGRSRDRWDPVVLLRCLLISALIGVLSLNKLAARLRSSPVLRALAGITPPQREDAQQGEEDPVPESPQKKKSRRALAPCVGTFYNTMYRLQDGSRHTGPRRGERPSDNERRRAKTPRPPKKKPPAERDNEHQNKKTGKPLAPTKAALALARSCADARNPNDVTQRLHDILWDCGVVESARKGLLGDVTAMITAGDGCVLETNANGNGRKICDCGRRKCDCDRIFADPDAAWGYDSYRKKFFYGHHFYEIDVGSEGHDMPLGIGIFPGNTSDHTASIAVEERLYKQMRDRTDGWKIKVHIADTGEDSAANHTYNRERGIRPVIAIGGSIPAAHPSRPLVKLSRRGIPLCEAGIEMSSHGTGGRDRPQFCCPVKAGKLEHCPSAPDDDPGWVCRPGTRLSPVVSVSTKRHPRLFPEISRNSPQYRKLYAQRTTCERSNGMKKTVLGLNLCGHRRQSFWLIRLYLAALLQHAKVWVSGRDARSWVESLLTSPQTPQELSAA